VDFIDVDPDCRDVREALQQLTLQPLTQGLIEALTLLLDFADLESQISRVQQGQQPFSDKTKYELQARLAAGTKYFAEVARNHDLGIEFAAGWIVYVMALAGELEDESYLEIIAKGFAAFSDMLARIEGLLRLLSLGNASAAIDSWLDHEWLVKQIALADDIDGQKAFISREEHQQRAEAQAASQDKQLLLAKLDGDARLAVARAKREEGAALATAERTQLERARFIKEVEDSAGLAAG
jgi:hypothetical protein